MSSTGKALLGGIVIGIVGTVVLAALAFYIVARTGGIPANADGRPGALERWIARTSLHAAVAHDAATLTDPLSANDATLLAGAKIYGTDCAVCHGDSSGKRTIIGSGVYQKAPALGRHGVEDDPEGETYWKVTHGIRFTAMPSFGKTLTDEQRWQVATFLKHMNALPPAAERTWRAIHVATVR